MLVSPGIWFIELFEIHLIRYKFHTVATHDLATIYDVFHERKTCCSKQIPNLCTESHNLYKILQQDLDNIFEIMVQSISQNAHTGIKIKINNK